MIITGYILAVLVGISLGLIGSGGSILTVPILVYIMQVEPVMATAYSLFIVGTTALVGGIQNAIQKKVDFKMVLLFGFPSIAAVYATRKWILPLVPDPVFTLNDFVVTRPMALMLLFAIVMVMASVSMIRAAKIKENTEIVFTPSRYLIVLAEGAAVGLLTGLVGAGGGFLIIPALVVLMGMPMKKAVGTSLFIIAAKSLIGFTGDLQNTGGMDWTLLFGFTTAAVAGIIIGILLSAKVSGAELKKAFGWFVLIMGIYMIARELGLLHFS